MSLKKKKKDFCFERCICTYCKNCTVLYQKLWLLLLILSGCGVSVWYFVFIPEISLKIVNMYLKKQMLNGEENLLNLMHLSAL